MYGIIYKITNTINGKCYVGQTTRSLNVRWNEHLYRARVGASQPFYNAIRKYGEQGFIKSILEECGGLDELNRLELYYTSLYRASVDEYGYVCRAGEGQGHMSEETKQKLSVIHMGKIISEETRFKISKAQTGSVRSVEARKNMSEAWKLRQSVNVVGINNPHYGKTHTDTTKKLISETKKGKPGSQSQIDKVSKEYDFISPSSEYVHIINLAKFCRDNGLTGSHMNRVALGKSSHYKGWRLVTQLQPNLSPAIKPV